MPQESEKSALKEKVSSLLAPLAVLVIGLGAGAIVYTSKPPVEEEPAEIKLRSVNTIAVESSSVSNRG